MISMSITKVTGVLGNTHIDTLFLAKIYIVAENVDILSLDSKDIVRFKVGVKPFLYDIFFKIDDITDEGWNDESINLGKRASSPLGAQAKGSGKAKAEKQVMNMENRTWHNQPKYLLDERKQDTNKLPVREVQWLLVHQDDTAQLTNALLDEKLG
ncbi:hypothetical protein ACJX0J_017719 [Zea mays]